MLQLLYTLFLNFIASCELCLFISIFQIWTMSPRRILGPMQGHWGDKRHIKNSNPDLSDSKFVFTTDSGYGYS